METPQELKRCIETYMLAKAHNETIEALRMEALEAACGVEPEDHNHADWFTWINAADHYEDTPEALAWAATYQESQGALKSAEARLLETAASFWEQASPELKDARTLLEISPTFRQKALELTLRLR